MTANLSLILTAGVLIAAGVYLLLERTLTRVLLGVILAGNGVNLLFLVAAGAPGHAAFVDPQATTGEAARATAEAQSDPLPQALVLTAIVITLGIAAFMLAMAYRSWQLMGHDEVQDDVEDRRVLARARRRAALHEGAAPDDLAADVTDDDTSLPGAESEADQDSGNEDATESAPDHDAAWDGPASRGGGAVG
ncbi:Na(+)/H(+) antiporter subunit C [Micrococcales bacterium 31B]|nr:Na(+)/H(+) antiporter subunit C [Micrococcales bacterium 31B]